MLHACPNLIFFSLDLCSFLEPEPSPSFNKILREMHFSQIERLEVRVDKCGNISAVGCTILAQANVNLRIVCLHGLSFVFSKSR